MHIISIQSLVHQINLCFVFLINDLSLKCQFISNDIVSVGVLVLGQSGISSLTVQGLRRAVMLVVVSLVVYLRVLDIELSNCLLLLDYLLHVRIAVATLVQDASFGAIVGV